MNSRHRPGSLALVVALHLAVLALLLMPSREPPQVAEQVFVSLGVGEHPSEVPAPEPSRVPLRMESPRLPAFPVPEVASPVDAAVLPAESAQPIASPAAFSAGISAELTTVRDLDFLRRPDAPYPSGARERREQGMVLVVVLVDELGRPKNARVYKSSGYPELDAAAVQAVNAALFLPRLVDGRPQSVRALVPIDFHLIATDRKRR